MKQNMIGLVLAVLTFGIGIFLFQNLNQDVSDNSCQDCAELHSRPINNITFSRLYESQKDFEGQVVRLTVTISNDDGFLAISDNLIDNAIPVGFRANMSWDMCSAARKNLKNIEPSLFGVTRAKATVIGRLQKSENIGRAEYFFKILCLERIS